MTFEANHEQLTADVADSDVWQSISRSSNENALANVPDSAGELVRTGERVDETDKTAREPLEPGKTSRVTLADGRVYEVYVPSSARSDQPLPLVLAAHGALVGDPSGNMERETGFDQMAEENGFIVAYPLSRVRSAPVAGGATTIEGAIWNTPGKDLNEDEEGKTYDDLVYIDDVLKDLQSRSEINIDKERIYGTGFSDGARLLELYAASRPQTLAALSAVHGTLLETMDTAKNGLPTMIVHGTGDDSLPLNGGRGAMSNGMALAGVLGGTDTSKPRYQFDYWSETNGAFGTPTITYETRDGEVIGLTTQSLGRDGPVKQTILAGADHAWHGRDGDGGHMPMGARDPRYQTSREVWDFMSQYKRHDGAIQSTQNPFLHPMTIG